MKALRITLIGAAALAATALLLLVLGIPADFLADAFKARLERETGYRLRIDGETKVGLWPAPTIFIRDVALFDPKQGDAQDRFKAESVRIALSSDGLLSGKPRVTEITIARPVLRFPLVRERVASVVAAPAAATAGVPSEPVIVDRVIIADGTIVVASGRDRVETRLDRINLDASLGSTDGRVELRGGLYWGDQLLRVELKADDWARWLDGQTIPVEFALQAPGLMAEPVSATAELRSRNALLSVNGLRGKIGRNSFHGWASVDFAATKPMLKGDVDFSRLDVPLASASGPAGAPSGRSSLNQPWSDREISLDALNFFDAKVQVSAAELTVETFAFAPITLEATIDRGVLQAQLSRAGLYSGQANGAVAIDASGPVPAHAMRVDLDGVSALPLLSEVADFSSLEGLMQAKIDVRATGASQRALLSTLAGTVDVQLANGAVRGIDLAKLIRNLTANVLNGWQQGASDKTELAQLSAQFRIQNGNARTDNLQLSGPIVRVTGAGAIDLPTKTLQFKIDPRLVTRPQGPGGTADAAGFGVPVMIQGNWSEPRIYPDVAGILDNPDAAYAQLKALGAGLFRDGGAGLFRDGGSGFFRDGAPGPSRDGAQGGGNVLDTLMQGLGNMLNRPPGTRRGLPGDDRGDAERNDR